VLDVILLLVFALFACGVLVIVNRLPDDDYFKYWVDCIPHNPKGTSSCVPQALEEATA
jgi:hypothetical protein